MPHNHYYLYIFSSGRDKVQYTATNGTLMKYQQLKNQIPNFMELTRKIQSQMKSHYNIQTGNVNYGMYLVF